MPHLFPPYPQATPLFEYIPLPDHLPAPVQRFYQTIIGDQIPVIQSAVLTLSGTLRFKGITFPANLRFTHEAGQNYRHYIEAFAFGYPLLKVNERYLDGVGHMELPFGVVEDNPKTNTAANLGLWGESIWLPSIFITDSRVRWEAIDSTTARLIVPCKGYADDSFTLTFDPETGLLARMEALRWRSESDKAKILWRIEPRGWSETHGMKIPSPAAVTWMDQGTPWLVASLTHAAYNVDVSTYIRGKGL